MKDLMETSRSVLSGKQLNEQEVPERDIAKAADRTAQETGSGVLDYVLESIGDSEAFNSFVLDYYDNIDDVPVEIKTKFIREYTSILSDALERNFSV